MQWLGPLASELGTLLFFVITGYKFQPSNDSLYSKVSCDLRSLPQLSSSRLSLFLFQLTTEDDEGQEYGLKYDESSTHNSAGVRSLGVTDILDDDDL